MPEKWQLQIWLHGDQRTITFAQENTDYVIQAAMSVDKDRDGGRRFP